MLEGILSATSRRIGRGTISDEVDERTLREIYMRQFEMTVRNVLAGCNPAAHGGV